jgi:hypothetical protein
MPLGLSWVFDGSGGVAFCGSEAQHASGQAFQWFRKAEPVQETKKTLLDQDIAPVRNKLETHEPSSLDVLAGVSFKFATFNGHFNPGLGQTVDWVDTAGSDFKGFSLQGSRLSNSVGLFFDIKMGSGGDVAMVRFNDATDWTVPITVRASASWNANVPTPTVCSREGWKGVYRHAPEELISGFINGNLYVHPGAALQPGLGSFKESGKNPDQIPDSSESCGMKQVLEYINYIYMLGGRPCCRWGGISFPYMPSDGKPRLHALHCALNGVYNVSWGHFFGPSYVVAYEPGKVAHG